MAIIKGTINNDLLLAGKDFDGLEDVVLGLVGDDEIDAGSGAGGNTLGGGEDNDLLYAGSSDLVLGDTGNDELDAGDEGGNNSLYGGKDQDTLYAGKNDKAFGGAGNDTIFAGTGNNTLYGGTGRDRFWIANVEVPTSVNTVADFTAQEDQIAIKLEGVNTLAALSFEQTGADTIIKLAATGENLAIVQNTVTSVFNSNNVIFDETAPLNTPPPVNNSRRQARKTVNGVENLGLVSFSTDTFFKDTQVGGLSGIAYNQAQNRYYAISDDRSNINPARFYTLQINLSDGRLDNGDVSFTQVTTLLDGQGNPFPANSLDTEGIALTENGSVYISSEGEVRPDIPRITNPFVNEFSLSGQQLSELPIDDKFFAVDGTTKGIRNNLAFESLTLTPDGRYLYTATENALAQDGPAATLTDKSLSRIVKYDLTTGQVVAEFVYEVDKVNNAPIPANSFANNGLVELLAIDDNGTLLALERAFSNGVGNTVKLYEIQTQNATNISSLDDIFSEADNTVVGVDSFVTKKLLVDFQADLGIVPDNLEGLALGPVLADGRQSLIVVSDNNFSATQTTQFIALALEIANPQPPINLNPIGTYATGQYDQSAAEIPAYDPVTKRLFVVNAQKGKVDVLDASNPTNPTLITSIDVTAFGLPNSVAIRDGLVAIAVENIDKQAKGQVLFYATNSQDFATPLKALEVGALPDMLTFSPDGKKVLVANEGEPNENYTIDPVGSVSIIDLSLGINSATVQTADFTAFNSQFAQLKAAGVKFKGDVGTTRTVAQDLEPEYIAISPDGTKAWVTLQEANAIAVVDIATATVESVKPLGFKDYSVPSTRLETFEFSNLPSIGKTAANQELFLGGFSGLFYEGTAANGNPKFVTHTDRGPNGEPTGSERPFLLPDFSPEIVRFELNRSTGQIILGDRLALSRVGVINAPMEESQEVATNAVVDTPAQAQFDTSLNGNTLIVKGSFSNLTSQLRDTNTSGGLDSEGNPIDSIHIHNAAAGANGPIIRALTVNADSTGLAGTFTGIFNLSDAEVIAVQNGNFYVNLHTLNNPGGELRGQINLGSIPVTGLPNLSVSGGNGNSAYNDELPVDLFGNPITPLDTFGGDLEGIVVNPNDGHFWMVDEYRPAIYHFNSQGVLVSRFVPMGTAAAAGQMTGAFGTEALPAVLAQRRQNRGFEAVALNKDNNKLYAFVQSPLRNPTTLSNSNLNNLNNVRIIEFDVVTETVTAEYLYRLDNGNLGTTDNTRPDKIGDAVYIGNGEFLLIERDDDAIDSDPLSNIEKKVYRFSLDGATNVLNQDAPINLGGGNLKTIDQMTPAELVSQGINLVAKNLHIDLAKAGYNTVEKVEGLTLVDANTIAVLNDNDFQVAGITLNGDGTFIPDPNPEPIVLGLITTQSQELDASDRDSAINIQSWPIFGMYQPDAIASYTANNQTYYITANEGDAREYGDYVEGVRISTLTLDPVAFPNAAELKNNANLGRLSVTIERGDTDGDGDYDQLYTFGGRSFSIWNSQGQLVSDSGDDFEQITAERYPEYFNASHTNNTFDNRSDDKGPEPEGVVTGKINGRTYAFVGLERIGGVMVYDVTDPVSPTFVQYINNRDFTAATNTAAAKDLGPEGLAFISAQDSPNGKPLLVVANEISGSTTFYEIDVNTLPVNNPPTAVILSNKVTELAENSNTTGGIKVATISITDDDQGTNILSLSGADATSFEIRNYELFFIGNSPNFETKNQYDVTVDVDDLSVGETPDASTDFTLNITDVNEISVNNPPTAVVLSNKVTELAENSNTTGGIKVATISITDDDQGTNVLSLSGADATNFEIRNYELFFIGNSPNFETKNQYDVTVDVDDPTVGETPDASTDFTLNITNISDQINNPPTAVILSNKVTELAENSNTTGGIKVATISITDDDQGTNVLSLSGADATNFEIRNYELFFIGNSPNFETKNQYDVTVDVDDPTVGETPDASTDFTLNITNLSEQDISDRVTQFNDKGENRGSLVYNLGDVSGNVNVQADDPALKQTDALFHNLVGLYQVENTNGAILDTLDLNGNGAIDDLLNPTDFGYARTAITNTVNNFVLQMGAKGNPTQNTNASEFGDVLLQGGKLYSPFAIANGGNLIPTGGTLQDGIDNFLAQNPNNTAANLSDFMTHAVAYFSFGNANPDGAEHLQNRGNNVFGFEDLPGNLGISDFDFNDAVFKFTFIA